MKAAIFDEPGLANLKVMDDVKEPDMSDHEVLVGSRLLG
jgi:hypothetical protein